MKNILLIFGLALFSLGSFAGQQIDLLAGSSVVVKAGQDTIVTCQANPNGSCGVVSRFCNCEGLGTPTLIAIMNDGSFKKYPLLNGSYSNCHEMIKVHPACK